MVLTLPTRPAIRQQEKDPAGRPSRIPALCAVAVLGLLTLAPDRVTSNNVSAAVYVLSIAALGVGLRARGQRIHLSVTTKALLVFYAALFVGTLTEGSAQAFERLVLVTGVMLGLAYLTSQFEPVEVRRFRLGVLWLSVLETAVALSQKFRGGPVVWGYLGVLPEAVHGDNPLWTSPAGRALGTMGHPIPLALLLGAALLLALTTDTIRRTPLRVLVIAVLVVGLLAAGTRSAALGLVPSLLWLLFTGRSKYRWIWRIYSVLGLAALLLKVNISSLAVIATLNDSDFSVTHRVGAFRVLGRLLHGDPLSVALGHGVKSISDLAAAGLLQDQISSAIDNNIVTVVAISGVIGLAGFLAFVVLGFARADRVGRAVILFLVFMFFSFDIVMWAPSMALVMVFCSTGSGYCRPHHALSAHSSPQNLP